MSGGSVILQAEQGPWHCSFANSAASPVRPVPVQTAARLLKRLRDQPSTRGIRKKKWVGPGKAPGPTHCIKTFMQAVPIAERTSIETARRHTVGRHQRIPRIKAPRNRESPRMPSKRAIISARSTFGPSYFDSSDDRVRSSRFMPGLSRRERRQSTLPLRSQGYSRANFLFCFLNLSLSVSAMFAVTSFR